MTQSLERLVALALETTRQRTEASVTYTNRPKQNALWLVDVPSAEAIVSMFPFVLPSKDGGKDLFIIVPGTEFVWEGIEWLMARRVTLYPDGCVLCARLSLRPYAGHLTSKDLARRAAELRWQIGEVEIDDYVIDL